MVYLLEYFIRIKVMKCAIKFTCKKTDKRNKSSDRQVIISCAAGISPFWGLLSLNNGQTEHYGFKRDSSVALELRFGTFDNKQAKACFHAPDN